MSEIKKKDDAIKEIEQEINAMISKNGWRTIDTNELLSEYKPISKYKNELGIDGKKANIILEKMGFISRNEDKDKIRLAEKAKKFGKELLSFFVSEKSGGILLSTNSFVYWNKKIVDEIKKYRDEENINE